LVLKNHYLNGGRNEEAGIDIGVMAAFSSAGAQPKPGWPKSVAIGAAPQGIPIISGQAAFPHSSVTKPLVSVVSCWEEGWPDQAETP